MSTVRPLRWRDVHVHAAQDGVRRAVAGGRQRRLLHRQRPGLARVASALVRAVLVVRGSRVLVDVVQALRGGLSSLGPPLPN